MPYFPIVLQHDDRRQKKGATPIDLRNVQIERDADGANARPFFAPTPGRVLVATLPADVRGLFCEPGCVSGHLHAAAGSYIYNVGSGWGFSPVGEISGGDVVAMRAFREKMVARSFGELYVYDGTSFTQITDADAPSFAQTLAVSGFRVVSANADGDELRWSVAGDATDWDASGVAADFNLPDPIVGQESIGGELASLNSKSIRFWQPTGGAEDVAFSPIPGADVEFTGLAGREAIATTRRGLIFVGNDRVVFNIQSPGQVAPLRNESLELALKSLTDAQLAACVAWSYRDAGKEFWGLSTGQEAAHVYEVETQTWQTRTRYGASAYDIDFSVSAYGSVIVASRDAPSLWRLDPDVLTDDGDPIERWITIKVPSAGDTPVNRVVIDARWRAQPNTGQGSAPKLFLDASFDNGEHWIDERELSVPALGQKFRVQTEDLGLANAEDGALLRLRISDPIGFSIYGVWVNPTEQEMNG